MIKQGLHTAAYFFRVTALLLLFVLVLTSPCRSQSVQFSMDVQPELGIEVLQDLNFGTVISNSGKQQIQLGDAQMGVFKIKALAAQSARLTLEKPAFLSLNENNDSEKIPVTLRAAYSNSPTGYSDIILFDQGSLDISLGNGSRLELTPTWETGYVFIYGDITIGNIEQGSYSGTLVLNVTYQ